MLAAEGSARAIRVETYDALVADGGGGIGGAYGAVLAAWRCRISFRRTDAADETVGGVGCFGLVVDEGLAVIDDGAKACFDFE